MHTVLNAGFHIGREDLRLPLAGGLGRVESQVGAGKQGVGTPPMFRSKGDAYRRAELNASVMVEVVGYAQGLYDPAGKGRCRFHVVVRDQHGEFIATEAADRHGRAVADRAQAAGDLAEQYVTDRMASRVIDELEAVEAEIEKAGTIAGRGKAFG